MINADALVVKTPDGTNKKLFLSSLRPPRLPTREDGAQVIMDACYLLQDFIINTHVNIKTSSKKVPRRVLVVFLPIVRFINEYPCHICVLGTIHWQ